MRATPERQPADFADILCGAELPPIVGGQAVNLGPSLRPRPAGDGIADRRVSKDATLWNGRFAEQLAHRAGWELHFDPQRDSIVAAILRKQRTPDEPPLTIEVLEPGERPHGSGFGNQHGGGIRRETVSHTGAAGLAESEFLHLASLVFTERPQDQTRTNVVRNRAALSA